jgi:hypothetical protein
MQHKGKKYYFLLLILMLPIVSGLYAQAVEELFLSEEQSGILEIEIDSEGNIIFLEEKDIVVQSTFGTIQINNINKNVFLSKYTQSFDLLWERPIEIDLSYGVILKLTDKDEIQIGTYDDQISIFTYDKEGTLINNNSFSNLIQTPVPKHRFKDFVLNENETIIAGMYRDSLVVGDSTYTIPSAVTTNSFVFSFNNNKEIKWTFKFYDNYSGIEDIYQFKNGNVLVMGNSNFWTLFEEESFNLTGWNFYTYLIMLNKDGKILWTKNINNSESLTTSLSRKIEVDKREEFIYLSGQINSGASISKYDSTGNLVWERYIERDEEVFGKSFYSDMVISESGNIYLAGKMFGNLTIGGITYSSTSTNRFDQLLVNYDLDGNFKTLIINEGTMIDEWITIDELEDKVIVAGFRDGEYGGSFDNFSHIMRYNFSTESIDEFYNQLMVAYPNPNPGGEFCIRFQNEFWEEMKANTSGEFVVKLYDSTGKFIQEMALSDESNLIFFSPGFYLPSGCYFLTVENGLRSESIKFVVTN